MLVAAVSTAMGSAAHSVSGQCLQPHAVAGGFVGVVVGSWVLARREVGWLVLVSWLGATQVFLHMVMNAVCFEGSVPVRHPLWMLISHTCAAVVTGTALRCGEVGVWAASRLRGAACRVRRLLRNLDHAAPMPPRNNWAPQFPVLEVPGAAREDAPNWLGRRGPPAVLLPA
ncbi:MAG: hypothetical protein NVSMB55_27470 [Mycobacteriales bacterium]